MSRLADAAKVLLGISTFQKPKGYGPSLSDEAVQKIRESIGGGQLNPLPQTVTRWYLEDLERAQQEADKGQLKTAAQICASMRTDGTIAGLLRTLTSGLVGLPKRFYGDDELAGMLRARNGTRSDFDDMHPPAELAAMAADGHQLGVAVGELVKVEGRDFPVLHRLEPEFLEYRWNENRWYYRSIAGLLEITPGDGHWVLHIPGGRVNPWRYGCWRALGRSFINKEHAMLSRSNYIAKLANPARAAVAPIGATEAERVGFLSRLISWGINTVFELPVGWDVKLIESKGEGYQVFKDDILQGDQEIMITLAGQIVTTTGGAGFSNSDVQRLIRADILQDVGDALAYTLNTQTLPLYALLRGKDPRKGATVEYQTKAPKDREAQARTMNAVGTGIKLLNEALRHEKKVVETKELLTQYELPTRAATPDEIESLTTADPDIKGGAKPEESDPLTRRDDQPKDE